MTTPAAPTREIIVRSFQPGCMRAAAYKGPHAGRTEHAGFLHFGDTAVAPNEVIGKSDPMNQVWPGITVEEGSLCFHIANLQKVLGNGKNGTCYIATASGRGYCFVAPILRSEQRSRESTSKIASTMPSALSPLSGPEASDNAGGRNRAPADGRNSFVHSLM